VDRRISFKRHRFPADVIRQAVWLYFRFTLSIRDVEELLAQRGIEVSREAVRCWVNKFGPLKLLRKLLKTQGIHPETITTDKLASSPRPGSLVFPAAIGPAACAKTTALRTLT